MFSDGIDVSVGDAILASHVDSLADNTEFNRDLADAEHDFDISTGDGAHTDVTATSLTMSGDIDANGNDVILSADGNGKLDGSVDDVVQVISGGGASLYFDGAGGGRIGVGYAVDADANLYINTVGYAGSTSRFRSLFVYDGKGALTLGIEGSTKAAHLYGAVTVDGDILTNTDKSSDIGAAATAWDDVYADDFQNVADFDALDDRSVVRDICAIRGSGRLNPKSGLEMIDDDTLPVWMLSRHRKDGQTVVGDEVVESHARGDVMRTRDGRPFLSLRTVNSALMRCVRELSGRIEALELAAQEK